MTPRTGLFWDRHNKRMENPEYAARFDAELARIRAIDGYVRENLLFGVAQQIEVEHQLRINELKEEQS